jgi:hypothetical protein
VGRSCLFSLDVIGGFAVFLVVHQAIRPVIATDPNSPLFKGALSFIALALLVGLAAPVFARRKDGARLRKIVPLDGSSASR